MARRQALRGGDDRVQVGQGSFALPALQPHPGDDEALDEAVDQVQAALGAGAAEQARSGSDRGGSVDRSPHVRTVGPDPDVAGGVERPVPALPLVPGAVYGVNKIAPGVDQTGQLPD